MIFGISIATVLRIAATSIIVQGVRNLMTNLIKRVYAAAKAVLARFPLSATALTTVAANFLARYGFDVSATTLAIVASAVAVFVASLAHGSAKSAARKAAR